MSRKLSLLLITILTAYNVGCYCYDSVANPPPTGTYRVTQCHGPDELCHGAISEESFRIDGTDAYLGFTMDGARYEVQYFLTYN